MTRLFKNSGACFGALSVEGLLNFAEQSVDLTFKNRDRFI